MNFKHLAFGALCATSLILSGCDLSQPTTHGRMAAAAPSGTFITVPAVSPTYHAAITGLVAASSATDVFTIYGSATKTIGIKRICVSGRATAAVNADVQLFFRTTANTSGTATNPTAVKSDSTDGAATATVAAYTANPTTGTGTVFDVRQVALGNLTTGIQGQNAECWVWHTIPGMKSPVLRGVAQGVAVNLNATSYSGNLLDITVDWTES